MNASFNTSLSHKIIAGCIGALALASGAYAAGDKTAYDHSRAASKTAYDAANKQCGSLSGNAKDICQAEAKAVRVKSDAQAEADYKNTPKAREQATDDMAKADYNVSKEKCDDLAGNPKDVCVKEAKATYDKVKIDAAASRKVSDVRHDAAADKSDANYKVAAEKCDVMAGDAKSACMAQAKAAYNK
ncbi:hypothetical protein BH09PSE5_BH09PSE5_50450 [soil metagenome]